MLLRGPVCRPCLPSMDGFGLRNSRCWALSPLISPPMPGPLALYSLTLTYSYVLIPPPSRHSSISDSLLSPSSTLPLFHSNLSPSIKHSDPTVVPSCALPYPFPSWPSIPTSNKYPVTHFQ